MGEADAMVLAPSQRYVEHVLADQREAEAHRTVRAVLALDICLRHKRELLSVCLWKLTEARPASKYALRFRTFDALAGTGPLRHEHIHQRKHLVTALLSGETLESAMSRVIACTVTQAEHRRLGESMDCDGWERYRRAGLRVVDTLMQCELDLRST